MRPNHGYQLMQSITEVSNGRIKMGPGTLYGVLSRMQKDGFIVFLKMMDEEKRMKLHLKASTHYEWNINVRGGTRP